MEYAFNVYTNYLEADRSYLRDDHLMFMFMFLNLLSLYLYLQKHNMLDRKYGVIDLLLILRRIKMYRTGKNDVPALNTLPLVFLCPARHIIHIAHKYTKYIDKYYCNQI